MSRPLKSDHASFDDISDDHSPNNNTTTSSSNGPLCASCDRCRQRKTKCNGGRPCSCCLNRYLKFHPTLVGQEIDAATVGCVYSVAKKRGPVPGNNLRKARSKIGSDTASDVSETRNGATEYGVESLRATQKRKTAETTSVANIATHIRQTSDKDDTNVLPAIYSNENAVGQQGTAYALSYPSRIEGLYKSTMGRKIENNNTGVDEHSKSIIHLNQPQKDILLRQVDERTVMALNSATCSGSNRLGYSPVSVLPGVINTDPSALGRLFELQQAASLNQIPSSHGQILANQHLSSGNIENFIKNVNRSGHRPGLSHQPIHFSATSRGRSPELPPNILNNSNQEKAFIRKESVSDMLRLQSSSGNLLRAHYHISVNELFGFPATPSEEEFCFHRTNGALNNLFRLPAEFDIAAIRAARYAELTIGAHVIGQSELASELASGAVVSLKNCVEEPVQQDLLFDLAKTYFLLGLYRWFIGDVERYLMYRRSCMAHIMQLEFNAGTNVLLAAICVQDSVVSLQFNFSQENLPDIDKVLPPLNLFLNAEAINSELSSTSLIPRLIVCDPSHQRWFQGTNRVLKINSAPAHCILLDEISCVLRSYTNDIGSMKALKQELIHFLHTKGNTEGDIKIGCWVIVHAMNILLEAKDSFSVSTICKLGKFIIENPGILFHAAPTYHLISNVAIRIYLWLHLYDRDIPSNKQDSMEGKEFKNVLELYSSIRYLLINHRNKLPSFHRCHQIPHAELEINEFKVDLSNTSCKSVFCRSFLKLDGMEWDHGHIDTMSYPSNDSDVNHDSLLMTLSQILRGTMIIPQVTTRS